MLNLENLKVIEHEELDDSYVIRAQSVSPNRTCSECGSPNTVIIGKVIQPYADTPMHGKTVKLKFERKRLKCKDCNKTCFEYLGWLSSDFRMTQRAENYVMRRCGKVPFLHVASELDVTEGTIRNVFSNYVAIIEDKHDWVAPRVLGIDETHFSKSMHLVMTDIENKTLLDMRRDRSQVATQQAIMRLSGWQNIEVICIDMWRPYLRAAKQLLPDVVVVVDRFHVAKMAGEAMEKARKSLRSELSDKERKKLKNDRKILLKRRDNIKGLNELASFHFWTEEYPALMEVYNAKEAYLGMWDMPTRKEAEDYWENWKALSTPAVRRHFKDAIRAIDNWHEYIFNWWDYRYTNAVTESLNNTIKAVFRNGRGYSFEVLRAKLLYTKGGLAASLQNINHPKRNTLLEFLREEDPEITVNHPLYRKMRLLINDLGEYFNPKPNEEKAKNQSNTQK